MTIYNSNKINQKERRLAMLAKNFCFVFIALLFNSSVFADALLDIDGSKDKHIRPDIKQQEFKPARIDKEKFEIVAYTGVYNIESYDTRAIFGVKGSFHLNKVFFIDIDYGNSTLKDQQINFDESLTRYDAGLGINLFQGQAFWREGQAINSQLFLKYSIGKIDVNNGKNNFKSFGLGLRLLHPNDRLSLQTGFNKDMIEDPKLTGLKYFIGLGVYF
jgi:hypothetical protein